MTEAKARADEESIKVFAENLRQLLLAAPLGQKRVLAIDPGFRTGCKVVCLDGQGNLLHNETIFPHPPQKRDAEAMQRLASLVDEYRIDAVAVGDGTAGRETEQLVRNVRFGHEVQVFMVSEDGASVYSASAAGREEFPNYDVTVRGAVSIGRRLIDPLAELVKIDPKSIGVGQYQHDVNPEKLRGGLDSVVESCVNRVGVNLNTASKHLLTYVSGLGPSLAQNIVEYRAANGDFASRRDLLKVSRLGAKAFEQCAGFLRIPQEASARQQCRPSGSLSGSGTDGRRFGCAGAGIAVLRRITCENRLETVCNRYDRTAYADRYPCRAGQTGPRSAQYDPDVPVRRRPFVGRPA